MKRTFVTLAAAVLSAFAVTSAAHAQAEPAFAQSVQEDFSNRFPHVQTNATYEVTLTVQNGKVRDVRTTSAAPEAYQRAIRQSVRALTPADGLPKDGNYSFTVEFRSIR